MVKITAMSWADVLDDVETAYSERDKKAAKTREIGQIGREYKKPDNAKHKLARRATGPKVY